MADAAIDRKAELERYYIQLLEKRIADLEAVTSVKADDGAIKKGEEVKAQTNEEKKSDAEAGQADRKERIRNVISKWDPQTGTRSDVLVNDPSSVDKDKGSLALTFRRVLPSGNSQNPNEGYSEVDIESQGLRSLLSDVIGEYTGQSWEGTIVNIRSPFGPIVHFWDGLQEASKESPGDDAIKKEARSDLKLLLNQVEKDTELEAYFKTRESNLAANLTTYETMWTLFVPGQRIFAKPFLGLPQMFVVYSPPLFWERVRGQLPATVEMDCWCYDWNGKEMVKVWYWIKFERFRGTKLINELVAYPIEFYKDENPKADLKNKEQLLDYIIDRGIRFDDTVRNTKGASQQHEYDGDALADRRNAIKNTAQGNEVDRNNSNDPNRTQVTDEKKIRPVKVKGKYIVDHEAFLTYGSGNHTLAEMEPNDVQDLDLGINDERTKDTPAGRKYLSLLPARYLGYATGDKFWGQFSVNSTTKVSGKRATMFREQLKLKDEYKQMIDALVNSQVSKNSKEAARPQVKDVAEDKGKGLVILLHGPPGVGKTLTAETIAEASQKPLFVVSVAEIGLDASKAEKNLEQMFALAGAWEAVLLVDEADVFLEMRSTDGADANRNALVSVLLRVLEYYQGIMILTTNRINTLDIAVQSRIHLAIRYEDLSEDYKAAIFKMFLDQLENTEPESIKNREKIDEWVEEYGRPAKLNGRQIRNVVSSALALARSKEEIQKNNGDDRLDVKHIKTVVRITHDFQEQLQAVTTHYRALNEVKPGGK